MNELSSKKFTEILVTRGRVQYKECTTQEHTMHAIDTTQNNPAPHFASTNRVIAIGRSGYTPRYTHVYNPSAEACAWDGADARTTHCIGSTHGVYSYVQIKVTGRADRWDVPGTDGPARKLRITVNLGTEDECVLDGWLIGGGDSI